MRIPRFAFVSMLVLILVLSGGLVLVRARAAQGQPTLLLHFTLVPDGKTGECWLTTNDNPRTNQCGFATDVPRGGMVGLMFRFVSRDGDRAQVGVKANYKDRSTRFNFIDDFKDVPEKMISVDPEQQAQIQVPDLGEFELTAAFLKHPFISWGRPDEAIEEPCGRARHSGSSTTMSMGYVGLHRATHAGIASLGGPAQAADRHQASATDREVAA